MTSNHHKEVFANHFRVLESTFNNLNTSTIITTTNSLRILLFDYSNGGEPIIDRLMKNREWDLHFEIHFEKRYEETIPGRLFIEWRELFPLFSDRTKRLTKEDFLKYNCLFYNNKEYNVRHIIEFYGYVKGGIHYDEKLSKERQELLNAFNSIKINSASQLDHSMRGIIQVVYNSLKTNYTKLLYN